MPRDHRGDADLANALASAETLATRCAREHRDVRVKSATAALLAAADRHRLRGPRPQLVLPPLALTLLSADGFGFAWFWVAVGMIFVIERLVTAWPVGWRGRLIAAPLVIEIGYDLVLQAVFLKSLFDIATGRAAGWNYVPRQVAVQSDAHRGNSVLVGPADVAVVPGPCRVRGGQHPRLRRTEPREAVSAPARVDHGRAAGTRGLDPSPTARIAHPPSLALA